MYLRACKYRRGTSGGVYVPCIYTHANTEDVPLVEFMYLVFTRMQIQKMYLWWSLCTLYLHACKHRRGTSGGVYVPCIYTHANTEEVSLVEFMYLVFTRMPTESYSGRLRSLLLYLCYVFRALINSLVRWFRPVKILSPKNLPTKVLSTDSVSWDCVLFEGFIRLGQ